MRDLKGMGDVVNLITEKTGIKKAVEAASKAIGLEDCGCSERREKLNVTLPFKRHGAREDS